MPYHVGKSDQCEAGQFAVIKDDDGKVMGCHDSEAAAQKQLAALYAQEPQTERRSAALVDAEVKGMNLTGYAAVFDTPWAQELIELRGYSESIARGAFRKALAAVNSGAYTVPLTWQHDPDAVLSTTRGNLKLREDGKGLLVETKLPDTTLGRDVAELIRNGDVQGMSYGIESLPSDSNVSKKNGVFHRSIANVRRLLDTTLTWDPAYPATSVELRTMGFAALPLQALTGGMEEQTGDDAVTETSSEASKWRGGFVSSVTISELEKGGWPLEGR